MPENENKEPILTVAEYIHLAASNFLYYVFLVFDEEVGKYRYSARDEADYIAIGRRSNWWSLAHTLLEWALHEWLEHESRLDGHAYDDVERKLHDSLNNFMIIAEQRVMAAARKPSGSLDWVADKRVPVSLYLYYCGWLFYVLHIFQEMHAQLITTAPQLTTRFDLIREEYKQLLEVLKEELESIGTIVRIDEEMAEQVRADIEATGKEMAQDWRQAVYETAQRIQAEA